MNSCIYHGRVRHRRYFPNNHEFSYKLFMMYLDLEELPTLFQRFWLWSYNKPNLAWFDRKQHAGPEDLDLATVIRQKVRIETGQYPKGPIRLLTHLKYFGYGFNPVSFYYCFEEDGETLSCIVAEVNNTPWNEQHCYVLPIRDHASSSHHFEFDKAFHVSPFNNMNQHYDWRFIKPEQQLGVHMNVYEKDRLLFDATMNLQKREVSTRSLSLMLFKFPFMTGKVIAAIYYQALKLWLKRTPLFTHPAKQDSSEGVNKV